MIWPFGPKNLDIEAGSDQLIALGVPHRAIIKAINFSEVGGGSTGGAFELYDSEPPTADGNGHDAHSLTDGEITFSGGSYRGQQLDIPYINRDGTPTNPVRKLWMRANLTGTGTKAFSLGMTIELAGLDG